MKKEVYTRKPKVPFKKLRQFYNEEISNRTQYSYHEVTQEQLQKIRQKLVEQRRISLSKRGLIASLLIATLSLSFYFLFKVFSQPVDVQANLPPTIKRYYHTVIKKTGKDEVIRVEYFKLGPKSAETKYRNGLKHLESISYYPTGEIFRLAQYDMDSLLYENYFFPNGDTLHSFPMIKDKGIYHLSFKTPEENMMEFDFFDHKILTGTFSIKRQRP